MILDIPGIGQLAWQAALARDLSHPLKMHNVFREDKPGESLLVDAALSNAPDRRGDFFGVPAILE